MMGGLGSGRPSARAKVDGWHSIDVNRLHAEGCLHAGWMGGLEWTLHGEEVTSITLLAGRGRLHLTYRVRIGDEWENVAETIRIVRVACRLGGSRPYFICPGVVDGIACGRRVTKLYQPGRYFLCRHCNRLSYSSQSEDACGRMMRRITKIRQRLRGDPDMTAPFPRRPKGMWRRTYDRLRAQASKAEMRAEKALAVQVGRLLAGIDTG